MSDLFDGATLGRALQELKEASRGLDAATARLALAIPAPGPSPVGMVASAAPDGVLGAESTVILAPSQRAVCERVINVFETGSVRGRYGAIAIFEDGPNDIRQITYGRSQTTEYGNLRELVRRYVEAGGTLSDALRPYVPLIGRTALVDDPGFKDLLRRGGEDPVMQQVQDEFFDDRYFRPALNWAGRNGFVEALSALVIYDSFIQSGGILDLLRARFPEAPPAGGGDERTWTKQYVDARHAWLLSHRRPAVRASAYRTRDLAREVARGNWDLSRLPILANGTPVDDGGAGSGAAALRFEEVPFLGQAAEALGAESWDDEEIWGDDVRPSPGFGALEATGSVAGSTASDLASRILADPRISLATGHVSGNRDEATARQNIADVAAGHPARRSAYGGAPGGAVPLSKTMLNALLTLAEDYSFSVSELAGGAHSPNSRHYVGVAVDVDVINGRRVGHGHPDLAAFIARCRSLGATEMRGPGNPHHDHHVHSAWPRTAS